MKKVVRILCVRKQKNVTFCDALAEIGSKLQLIYNNDLLKELNLSSGDIISFEGEETVNKKGDPLTKVLTINWINHPINWTSPQGVKGGHLSSTLEDIRLNARTGGKQISLWKCKENFKKFIKNSLNANHFIEIGCKSIELKRTSAARKPLHVTGENTDQDLFLRITMENQLKQACSILLNSVYSIDNVFYDKSVTGNVDRELTILEFVSLEFDSNDIVEFIKTIECNLQTLYTELNLENLGYSLPSSLKIIDYNELPIGNINYESFSNTVIKNVPVDSPFVEKDSSGKRNEIQWIVRGKMIAHGYKDETCYSSLLSTVKKQKEQLGITNCNEMDYITYAIPQTYSFGLGIDQLLRKFYNLENLVSISNPLGFYFD